MDGEPHALGTTSPRLNAIYNGAPEGAERPATQGLMDPANAIAAPPVRKLRTEVVDPRQSAQPLSRTKPAVPRALSPVHVPVPDSSSRPSPLMLRWPTSKPASKPGAPPPLSKFFGGRLDTKGNGKGKAPVAVESARAPKVAKKPLIVPKKEEGPRAVGRAKQYAGPNAQKSTQDDLTDKYRTCLINGTKGKDGTVAFAGIMRAENRMGDDNVPYAHQRVAVKDLASRKTQFFVLAHDMGTGKTATVIQGIAAEAVMHGRRIKALISAPATTLPQWKDAILDWLRIEPERILVTNELKRVTKEALLGKDIVVVSRDLVSNAYASYMKKYERHHTIDTPFGHRHVSAWDRKGYDGSEPMPPVHPLFDLPTDESAGWSGKWDMFAVDEAYVLGDSNAHPCALCSRPLTPSPPCPPVITCAIRTRAGASRTTRCLSWPPRSCSPRVP